MISIFFFLFFDYSAEWCYSFAILGKDVLYQNESSMIFGFEKFTNLSSYKISFVENV